MAWSPGPGATPNNDYFLGGDGGDFADGKAGDDILNGLDGNDTLLGNTGADTLFGATGNDSLSGDDGNDYVFDTDGNDTVSGGAGDDTVMVDDRYASFGDTDRIDGGSGADLIQVASVEGGGTLIGGADFDTLEFYVSQSDFSVDLRQYSIDTIERLNANMALYGNISDFTQFTYLRLSANDATLASQISITLKNSGSINLLSQLGVQSAYIATNGSGNNYAQAGGGNDNLVGGTGNDTLDASAGNDNIDGAAGNDLLYGFIGDDSLYGGYGNDESAAGTGDDLIIDIDGSDTLNGDDGNDTIYNLNFTGGTDFTDAIDGGDGDDQVYIGGTTAGSAYGGNGNDLLLINQVSGSDFSFAALTVGGFETLLTRGTNLTGSIETFASFGTIRISSDTFDLLTPIHLTLTNGGTLDLSASLGPQRANITAGLDPVQLTTGSGDATVTATDGNDTVSGGNGSDVLYGGIGADILNGGNNFDRLIGDVAFDRFRFVQTSDYLYGGDGNDFAEGDGGGDFIYGGNGNDFLLGDYLNQTHIDVDDMSGGDYIEGGDGNDTIKGNDGDDILHGGLGNDSISGTGPDPFKEGGNNQLYGEDGDDYLYDSERYDLDLRVSITATTYMDGGMGADTFECSVTYGTILGGADPDGNALGDVLRVSTRTLVGLTMSGVETLDARGTVTAAIAQFEAFDHIIDTDTAPYVEHIPTLKLFDAGAIDLSDELGAQKVKITASAGGNTITTGSGDDTLTGGAGGDTLYGRGGNDSLSGAGGADTMYGGTGNDTYTADTTGDVVTEIGGQGTDTVNASVSYTLGFNIEVLNLTGAADIAGTGNSTDNSLNGNAGNNSLNGAGGNDTMTGGLGNDTYYVNAAGDRVFEADGGGIDTVLAGVSFSGAGQYIENITLLGSGDFTALGNGVNNLVRGNSGHNRLDGGAGADTLAGGLGNDSYYVDNAGDVTIELNGQGTDTVYAGVSYALGATAYIEVLALTGAGHINATGNGAANSLRGNSGKNSLNGAGGNDILTGGAGNDTLIGGTGADVFVFGLASGQDVINDFKSSQNDTVNIHAYSKGVVNGGGVTLSAQGSNTLIDLGGGDTILVLNIIPTDHYFLSHIVW